MIVGPAPFSKSTPACSTHVWKLDLVYVTAVVDATGVVAVYAVTVIDPHQPVSAEGVELGTQTFQSFGAPSRVSWRVGAHNLSWVEASYLANPGDYKTH